MKGKAKEVIHNRIPSVIGALTKITVSPDIVFLHYILDDNATYIMYTN